ncbi:MAG: LysR substrate-binding domain-containing protein [Myxococcota bacterium]
MPDLDLNLDDLGAFVQVVESGGFTAAGRVLDRSTKQMSRQVRRLEDQVGVRLLHRTTRAVSLTEAGERFLGHALRILDEVRRARNDLEEREGELRGRLRVALPTLASVMGLASWLATLRQRHPGIALDLMLIDRPLDLVAEGYDLQLTSAPPSQTTLLLRRLFTITLPLAAHTRYLADRPGLERPEDLADHDCLRFVSDRPQQTWSLVGPKNEAVTVPVSGSLQSGNSEVLFAGLRAGVGIGVCAPAVLDSDAYPDIVRVLPEWTFEPLPLFASLPRANRHSPLVEAFLAVVLDGLEHGMSLEGRDGGKAE